MKLDVKESLSLFVVDVLLFQRSMQVQNADLQLVKQELLKAALSCEEAYVALQESPAAMGFKKAIKTSLDQMQKASYWLRILQEAKIGDEKEVVLLIEASNRIKENLEQVRNTTKKRLIPAQGVAA